LAAKTLTRRITASRVAGIERACGSDDPRLPELRRALRTDALAEHIRASAPTLTLAQRHHLAALLLAEAVTDVPA
jgi:hypothetical protein